MLHCVRKKGALINIVFAEILFIFDVIFLRDLHKYVFMATVPYRDILGYGGCGCFYIDNNFSIFRVPV